MGKGTDKLYLTHSEWSSDSAYGASAGGGVSRAKNQLTNTFKQLPFNCCSISFQPVAHGVCTDEGQVFELTNILPWIKKHGSNPVNGKPLQRSDLFKLNLQKSDEKGKDDVYVDPVTQKPFNEASHIVVIKNTGNAFSWETIQDLNIKARNLTDLVSDQSFTKADIVTIQDPRDFAARSYNDFKHIKEGTTPQNVTGTVAGVSAENLGSAAKVLKAKEAVAAARAQRAATSDPNRSHTSAKNEKGVAKLSKSNGSGGSSTSAQPKPHNAARHTTGQAAASFTSTGLTPHTSGELAILSEEDYLLKPRKIKTVGYVRMTTTHGPLLLELYPEYAPKAVWNFVRLSQRGYYDGVRFHRNIAKFMIQGGDPSGTGKGGQSVWGKQFDDETAQNPLRHDARGVLSMANKGRDTNSSQFFVLYKAASHLDGKHTIFGRVARGDQDSETTLDLLERVEVGDKSVPVEECSIKEVTVLVDPFEEFQKNGDGKHDGKRSKDKAQSGAPADRFTTWTGKRLRKDGVSKTDDDDDAVVGKYLKTGHRAEQDEITGEILDDWSAPLEAPPAKKRKPGAFGNFDNW